MKNGVNVVLVALILMMGLSACDKDKNYPDTPFLEFKSYNTLPNDSLQLVCYFRDGDGDIGSSDILEDPSECFNNPDVQIDFQQMINGEWEDVEVIADYCVLSMTPEGQDKTLEGDIQYNFPHPLNPEDLSSDTVRYGMLLRDRNGNESDWVWGTMLLLE